MQEKKYVSRYTKKLVTAASFIAELTCERGFKKRGMSLPSNFWSDERFRRDYLMQLRFANSLLKIYSAEAIINALNSTQGKNIYSLGAKWLDPLIAVEEVLIKKRSISQEKFEAELQCEYIDETLPVNREEKFVKKDKNPLLDL